MTTPRARTLPYRPELHADQRVCARCGIIFRFNASRRKPTECRDCRYQH